MAYADDLLVVARDLVNLHPSEQAHQASLRRAVSTAYYALFHLLVSEATTNWAQPELRATLGRCFQHGQMKTASAAVVARLDKAVKGGSAAGTAVSVAVHLGAFATTFVQAQERREEADYNIAKQWTALEVKAQIAVVNEAFEAWKIIRDDAGAQAYLVSLLGPTGRRSSELKA